MALVYQPVFEQLHGLAPNSCHPMACVHQNRLYNPAMAENESSTPSGLKPVVQSFILADHVYVDARSGKKVIAGTFNQVHLGVNQTALHRVFAYLAVINCRGRVEIQLRHVDLADGSELRKSGVIGFDAADPLQTYEIVIEVPPLPMPHEGAYALEAYCNDELAGSIRIGVKQKHAPEEDGQQNQ